MPWTKPTRTAHYHDTRTTDYWKHSTGTGDAEGDIKLVVRRETANSRCGGHIELEMRRETSNS